MSSRPKPLSLPPCARPLADATVQSDRTAAGRRRRRGHRAPSSRPSSRMGSWATQGPNAHTHASPGARNARIRRGPNSCVASPHRQRRFRPSPLVLVG